MTAEIRTKICAKFQKAYRDKAVSEAIECGIWNATVAKYSDEHGTLDSDEAYLAKRGFRRLYMARAISVYVNLDPKTYVGNTELKKEITKIKPKAKRVETASELAERTPQELYPTLWEALVDKKEQTEKYMGTRGVALETEQFTCRRCHKNRCSYYSLQTRSIDEPMTTFVQCLECGNRWHM